MNSQPVIGIFDIGKTNKKFFLFDDQYHIVFEKSGRLSETIDEDGFPCEDLDGLRRFVWDMLREIFGMKKFEIRAINFSAYGASLVYVGNDGKPLAPLYNYLKPFPEELRHRFYQAYGEEEVFSLQTASPALGSLNAGLQLYRLKNEKTSLCKYLKYALHLPQYLSYLITGKYYSDLTSIGCHTALWDFKRNTYHDWISREKLNAYLAPIERGDKTFPSALPEFRCEVGIGLHDSSAALIPYLINFSMPFVLISTGTWSISMNPFNKTPLTNKELRSDCLCYLQYQGEPVKASRLHAGLEHEQQVSRIAEHFGEEIEKYKDVRYDPEITNSLRANASLSMSAGVEFNFRKRNLSAFKTDAEAYHQLISDLVDAQIQSTQLVMAGSPVKRIFVDGGFSKNSIFMHLLANGYQELEVFAASMAQATALGAALVIHESWNLNPVPNDMIDLTYYSPHHSIRK